MENPFVRCPYNPQHRMLKLRLQNHIVRCRENYINAGMQSCPYNATHIVSKEKYADHVRSCPEAKLIEEYRYRDLTQPRGNITAGTFHFAISQEEDWESPLNEVDHDGKSEISESNASKDSSNNYESDDSDLEYFIDYGENEEPLQGFYYEKNKSNSDSRKTKEAVSGSLPGSAATRLEKKQTDVLLELIHNSRTGNDVPNEVPQKTAISPQMGIGRGKLLNLLAESYRR